MSVAPSAPTSSFSLQPLAPLSVEQEDQIILARITNDERYLRRVIKKFHNYASLAQGSSAESKQDAKEAFIVELSTFRLALKKSAMVCEAEARQVEEYQSEKLRIGRWITFDPHSSSDVCTDDEHGKLRGQIEQLKTSLEHAQMLRRRKMEYDFVTEKINTLPSREELNQCVYALVLVYTLTQYNSRMIQALENDMMAIRSEHDTQNRTIQSQKGALEAIISDLGALRSLGKDTADIPASLLGSPRQTPALDGSGVEDIAETRTTTPAMKTEDSDKEEGEADKVVSQDIEMGEVEEEDKNTKNKKKTREDMEEGEATDASSELSDPPDDD
ncbi:Tho complex subunit 7-domain-containing protein [Desarmillaria tabescens]|uniref:Tho complex subunit 7-domain-containing protein n=1 Tax=Armillaria tabescens TaxID=1929756 RepID=A0AA39NM50_ARMTA|nr:Tho complex subunit 7-domain-containing protein [Desarmillaria tabescens]KAK0468190.1 Tho complex subunit 7-domain-containing protein [Desarmillaria tabescens]